MKDIQKVLEVVKDEINSSINLTQSQITGANIAITKIENLVGGLVEARVIRKTPEAEEEKTITFNFDETVDGEAAIFALYAGLRMYKELKDKQPKEPGKFSIPAAEAYCMLEQIKEKFPDDYIECMLEYDKVYGER